jgi:hypothetical protein
MGLGEHHQSRCDRTHRLPVLLARRRAVSAAATVLWNRLRIPPLKAPPGQRPKWPGWRLAWYRGAQLAPGSQGPGRS